jgi:hypothetical protein
MRTCTLAISASATAACMCGVPATVAWTMGAALTPTATLPVVNLWVAWPRAKPHESAARSTKDQTGGAPPRCPHQLGPPSQQSNSKLDPPALRERTHTTSSRCARDDNFVVACVAPAVETSLRARVWAQLECHGREEISVRRFGRCKSCSSKVSKETTRVHPRN